MEPTKAESASAPEPAPAPAAQTGPPPEGEIVKGRISPEELARVTQARARADAVTQARARAGEKSATVAAAAAKVAGGSTSVNNSVVSRGPGRPPKDGSNPPGPRPAPAAAPPAADPATVRALAKQSLTNMAKGPNLLLAKIEVDAAPLGCQPGELVLSPAEVADLAEGTVTVLELASPTALSYLPAFALLSSCATIVLSRWIVYRRLDARAEEMGRALKAQKTT